MGKTDTVVDDLRKIDAETGLRRVMGVLAKLNEVDRSRVLNALIQLYSLGETGVKS